MNQLLNRQEALAAERSRLEAELLAARKSFMKELRNLGLLLVIFMLGVILELYLKPSANLSIFLLTLLLGPTGAALAYTSVRLILARCQLSHVQMQLRGFDAICLEIRQSVGGENADIKEPKSKGSGKVSTDLPT